MCLSFSTIRRKSCHPYFNILRTSTSSTRSPFRYMHSYCFLFLYWPLGETRKSFFRSLLLLPFLLLLLLFHRPTLMATVAPPLALLPAPRPRLLACLAFCLGWREENPYASVASGGGGGSKAILSLLSFLFLPPFLPSFFSSFPSRPATRPVARPF